MKVSIKSFYKKHLCGIVGKFLWCDYTVVLAIYSTGFIYNFLSQF